MAKSSQSQVAKFTKAARELGVDEDEARFKAKLRKISRANVPAEDRKKPKRPLKTNENL